MLLFLIERYSLIMNSTLTIKYKGGEEMRCRSKHTSRELVVRAQLALENKKLIEVVEAHEFPNGAQKAAKMLGFKDSEVYSTWALGRLKRDYFEIYKTLTRRNKASKGTVS